MASITKRRTRNGKARYSIQYYERPGLRRTRYAKSLDVAKSIKRKVEEEAERRRHGLVDPLAERLAAEEAKHLGQHVEDFIATLRASGTTPKHLANTKHRLEAVIVAIGANRIGDLTPSAAQRAVGAMLEGEEAISLRTANSYLTSVKHFSRWLWRDGRARTHVLAPLKGYNVATDRRRVRRALSDLEIGRLLRCAFEGPNVLGMIGPDRAMLYALAVGTGLRANELRSLTPESFALDATPATVTVEAGYSKHRRRDVLPLPPALASGLKPWLASKAPGERVFKLRDRAAEMLRADLTAAEIPITTQDGVADFHSLRHTFISRLVRSGVNVKLAQELARHSDPKLTLNVYSHVGMEDKALAMSNLPELAAPRDGAHGERSTANCTALAGHRVAWRGATWQDADDAEEAIGRPIMARNTDSIPFDVGGPCPTRTDDRRIMSPLL